MYIYNIIYNIYTVCILASSMLILSRPISRKKRLKLQLHRKMLRHTKQQSPSTEVSGNPFSECGSVSSSVFFSDPKSKLFTP